MAPFSFNAASPQPGTNWTLYGSSNDPNTGDIYSGLDRFGRVDNCLWQKGSTTLAQVQYGYDRASNRTWRKDGVLTGYDELYLYDGLNRLKDQLRGTLNGTQTAITSSTFQQQWGLDATGNWQAFKQDTDGNGTWDLVQSRTANKANEITAINNTTGTAWVAPGYDKAGNMIGIPNPTISSTATYDAWNRLVGVTDASTSITNDYDARGFRITETTGGVVRHYYYTPGWQCVEERTGTLTTPERQFVWGMRYIDDLVIRDRSTANNGSINERRYAMQDGNWNTVAICDITGSVGERYAYSAYGTPVFMTGAGTVQASSPIGFETLYAGYRWDNATPQMYYVRNRFLLPQVGTWNKRDPLGYVNGASLSKVYGASTYVDPFGTAVFIGGGGTYRGVGGGGSGVTCCDENNRRKVFIYTKVCLPPTLVPTQKPFGRPILPPQMGSTGASITAGVVFGMDGNRCRKDTYEGWFMEWSAYCWVGVHVDIGFGEDENHLPTKPSGCWEAGAGVGTPGWGYSWCYYFHQATADVGPCKETTKPCEKSRRTTTEEAEGSLHKMATDYCWDKVCKNDPYPPSCMERCIPNEIEYLRGKMAGSGPILTIEPIECGTVSTPKWHWECGE